MSEKVVIVLDCREIHVKKELENLSIKHSVQQLHVGDIVFKDAQTDKLLLVCERKTHADLYSSIISGRFSEQRERLKNCNAKVVYILENYNSQLYNNGSPLVKSSKNADKGKVVSGALENLILQHNMYILPTHSAKHTAQSLGSIKGKLEKGLTDSSSSPSALPATVSTQRKHKIMDNIFHHQLLLISGISPEIAAIILQHYPTVHDLFKAYEKCTSMEQQERLLENIPLEKRRLGKVISKRIHDVYWGQGQAPMV